MLKPLYVIMGSWSSMSETEQKLLRRMAAHQLRMGQALVILLGGGTAGGDPKDFIMDNLGEQNYALERAIVESV